MRIFTVSLPVLVSGFQVVSFTGVALSATDQFWNIGGTGGSGNWSSGPADKNWNTAVGAAGPNVAWPGTPDDVANFQDAVGGTVTVFGSVDAAGIVQDGAGYALEGGTITLIDDAGGNAPVITVNAGSLSIGASLAGSDGFVKAGTGTLTLDGLNTYSGDTAINAGTLALGAPDQLSDGGLLTLGNGATLALGANSDTAASLVSNGGSLTGTGTLTAGSYALNDGTTITANLGTGTLTSNGNVNLAGTAGSGTVIVASGTLTLGGNNLADGAVVGNSGTLLMNGSDTVALYSSAGGTLSGPGTLTAKFYGLSGGALIAGNLGTGEIGLIGNATITGTAAAGIVKVDSGTLTLGGDNLADTADLSNKGTVAMNGSDTVGTYVSNGGTLSGPGTLTAATYTLNGGSIVTGNLGAGDLRTLGNVEIRGAAASTTVDIGRGRLLLYGNNLSDEALVTLQGGTLFLVGSDVVGTLVSNNGRLRGPGTLNASDYFLNDGTSVESSLGAGNIVTNGNVEFSSYSAAGTVTVASGVLTNLGILGDSLTRWMIASGARLIANGRQTFASLTTSAGGTGIWQGLLENTTKVAPGGLGGTGGLRVEGDFMNAPAGTLAMDVGPGASDFLDVTGTATFAGTLDLNAVGIGQIEPSVAIQLIGAGAYVGNFDSLTENLEGTVFFNPGNGTITRLEFAGNASLLSGVTANQASTWISLYDDVIDPGSKNISYRNGSFQITSGVASSGDPDLMWALAASITPTGLDRGLLNRLSPEVYHSLSDYAVQATRSHRRTALRAPGFASTDAVAPTAGSEDAKSILPAGDPRPRWEAFAAVDYFDVGTTTGSLNQADYGMSGTGFVAGARVSWGNRFRLAGYLAGDDGRISGDLIDADGSGLAVGILGEVILDPVRSTRLVAGISYGSYSFDGSRGGVSASAAGWSPGFASFSDVDSDATDIFLGLDSVVYQRDRFRLIPSIGLNFTTGSTDAFREVAGSAIPLAVESTNHQSFVSELSLAGEYEVTPTLTLSGQAGMNLDLQDRDDHVTARFASGSRPMTVRAEGLSDQLFFLGLGASWAATESVHVNFGYRAEFRTDADPLNGVSLGASIAF